MTDVALQKPAGLPSVAEWEMAVQMADTMIKTAFVGESLRKQGPAAVLACILAGKELGIGPMTSLREIDVIQGQPSPSGQLVAALARRGGHTIEILEYDEAACTVRGTRADDATTLEVRWTITMADKIGLTGKKVWQDYPRSMLLWRCLTELGRALFSGETLGFAKYTTEELGRDELPEQGEAAEVLEEELALDSDKQPAAEYREVLEATDPDGNKLVIDGPSVHVEPADEKPELSTEGMPEGSGLQVDTTDFEPLEERSDVGLLHDVLAAVEAVPGMEKWTVETVLRRAREKWGDPFEALTDLSPEQVGVVMAGIAEAQTKLEKGQA